jgi:hypothetical protein
MHSHSPLPKVAGFFILQEAQAMQMSSAFFVFAPSDTATIENHQNFGSCQCTEGTCSSNSLSWVKR